MRSPVLEDIRVGSVPWPARGQRRLLLRTLGRRVAAIVLFSGLAFACDESDTRSDDDAGTLSTVSGDDATDASAGPVGDNMVDMAQPAESATQDASVYDNGGATTASRDADIDRTDANSPGSNGGEVTELNRDAGDVGITDIDSEFAVGGESGQMLDSTTNDAHQSAPDAAVRSDMMGAPECPDGQYRADNDPTAECVPCGEQCPWGTTETVACTTYEHSCEKDVTRYET